MFWRWGLRKPVRGELWGYYMFLPYRCERESSCAGPFAGCLHGVGVISVPALTSRDIFLECLTPEFILKTVVLGYTNAHISYGHQHRRDKNLTTFMMLMYYFHDSLLRILLPIICSDQIFIINVMQMLQTFSWWQPSCWQTCWQMVFFCLLQCY